jgi:CSLREA domain-containing protein
VPAAGRARSVGLRPLVNGDERPRGTLAKPARWRYDRVKGYDMGPGIRGYLVLAKRGALSALATFGLLCVVAGSALGDSTVNVTTTSDAPSAGQCSLREAITYANGTPEGDCAPGTQSGTTTINLPGGTYTLSGSGLSLSRNAVLNGAGASSTTISGGNAVQVLNVAASAQVTINGLTISKGMAGNASASSCGFFAACAAGPGNNGGGIANAGSLTLVNSAVSGNAAGPGFTQTFGFVLCGGFPFPDCTSHSGGTGGNGGNGGGIYNNGQLTIQNSTISGNNAGAGSDGGPGATGTGSNAGAGSAGGGGGFGGQGGGILNDTAGTATITSTTITGNSAGAGGNGGQGSDANSGVNNGGAGGFAGSGGIGGGIVNFGKLTLTGSTVSANSTGQGGSGGAGGNPSGGGSAGAGRAGGFGGSGGAFYADSSSSATLTNDTINGNTASAGGTGPGGTGTGGDGGAVWHFDGLLQMSFVTVTNNSAVHSTGGVLNDFGTITETDSIIASNTAGLGQTLNCTPGQVTDEGGNVIFGDNSCPGSNGDPKLGALTAANGGPTPTMALEPGSVALDHVPITQCPAATDQRGVARPQRGACDAGAYEVAPPAITSPSATGTSTSTASVTANVNPNFSAHDTTVTVRFGTTPAYGSTTPPQDVGAGGQPVSFSANLAGLAAGTTYHFQIVATNGDGTTTSGDGTFQTTLPTAASIASSSSSGPLLSLVIACNGGGPTSRCSGPITLTSHVITQGSSIVAVTAVAKRHKPKPKRGPKKVTKRVIVGRGTYSVATGTHSTVKIRLNAEGLKLLAARYKLPVTVTLTGAGTTSKTVILSYARLHILPAYQWAFSKTFAFATQLTLSGLPRKSHVAVVCRGNRCPFARRSFRAPKRGKLDAAAALKQRHLGVGSTVDLQITATNTVGEVVRFTVLSGKLPKESFLCLPPGARTPSACAS